MPKSSERLPQRPEKDSPEALSPGEAARSIAEFTAELSYLARRSKLDLLAYLLDMARLEAVRAQQEEEQRSAG